MLANPSEEIQMEDLEVKPSSMLSTPTPENSESSFPVTTLMSGPQPSTNEISKIMRGEENDEINKFDITGTRLFAVPEDDSGKTDRDSLGTDRDSLGKLEASSPILLAPSDILKSPQDKKWSPSSPASSRYFSVGSDSPADSFSISPAFASPQVLQSLENSSQRSNSPPYPGSGASGSGIGSLGLGIAQGTRRGTENNDGGLTSQSLFSMLQGERQKMEALQNQSPMTTSPHQVR